MRHGRRHRPAVGLILAASLAVTVAAAADAGSGEACTGKAPETPSTIVLPPGSHQLARAIDSVAPGGTIVLQAGRHSESRGVVIDKPLALLGLPGAELEVRTSPSTGYPLRVDPALTIRRTSHVQVRGLTLLPRRSLGGAAILIDGS